MRAGQCFGSNQKVFPSATFRLISFCSHRVSADCRCMALFNAALYDPLLRLHCLQINSSTFLKGQQLAFRCQRPVQSPRVAFSIVAGGTAKTAVPKQGKPLEGERLRLSNLAPQPGSRRKDKRKGRGYGAGQARSFSLHHIVPSYA